MPYNFPVIHSSKRKGYEAYRHKTHNPADEMPLKKPAATLKFVKIFAGLWINYVTIDEISIHLWFKDDSIPSNAITLSLESFKFTGELDKIRKHEDIKRESLWKLDVIPNFIPMNDDVSYYLANTKLSINDIEIRTTRNAIMDETLNELNPMKETIEGHIVICEIYENERKYGTKWSKQLLPTDRAKWSSVDGRKLDKDKDFILPKDWAWVTEWDWNWNTYLLFGDADKLLKNKLKTQNAYKCDQNGWVCTRRLGCHWRWLRFFSCFRRVRQWQPSHFGTHLPFSQ